MYDPSSHCSLERGIRLRFFSWVQVRVVHDPDEYSTDLGKCVKELGEIERERALPAVCSQPLGLSINR